VPLPPICSLGRGLPTSSFGPPLLGQWVRVADGGRLTLRRFNGIEFASKVGNALSCRSMRQARFRCGRGKVKCKAAGQPSAARYASTHDSTSFKKTVRRPSTFEHSRPRISIPVVTQLPFNSWIFTYH
jgi:hypothetical protein